MLAYRFRVDCCNACGAHNERVVAVAHEHFHSSLIRLAKDIPSMDGMLEMV